MHSRTDNRRSTTNNRLSAAILLAVAGAVLAMAVTGCTGARFGADPPRLELAVPPPLAGAGKELWRLVVEHRR